KRARVTSIILISDFQESLFVKSLMANDSSVSVFPIAIRPTTAANISIDTCWLDNPMTLAGQNNQLTVRINNR
ncbi:MAG: hypothetical protein PHY99_10615, partial [Bacteroidales bacterium]|nr:hypothetical protein [Bacteroidales bacterium]